MYRTTGFIHCLAFAYNSVLHGEEVVFLQKSNYRIFCIYLTNCMLINRHSIISRAVYNDDANLDHYTTRRTLLL